MIGHYRRVVLAAYTEGMVRARKAAKIRLHLATCARCAGTTSHLTAVPTLLAGIQAPPMPDQIAARISRALASESATRTSSAAVTSTATAERAAAGPVTIPGRPDLPEPSRRRSRWFGRPERSSPVLLRAVAATAALAVLAGAGFLLARGQSGSISSNAGGQGAGTTTGRTAHSVAAAPNKFSGAQPATTQVSYHRGNQVATTTAVTSAANVTHKTLAEQVRKNVETYASSLQNGVPQPTASAGSNSGTSQPASFRLGPLRIPQIGACLTRIAAGRSVILADVARFLGKRAIIVVFAPAAAARVFDVEVVGLACSAAKSDLIARAAVPVG